MVKARETSTINKAAIGVDMSVIDSRINGYENLSRDRHVLKTRINSGDALGDALELSYKKFKFHIDIQEDDLDQGINLKQGSVFNVIQQ